MELLSNYRDIAEDSRSGNADNLTEEVIKSTLANLKGEALGPNHWEDTPIISSDNTPNEYGRLLAQIIFDHDRIRTTDEYLPTTINDETADHGGTGTSINDIIIQPTSADIRKACYAIGLDGPSIDSIDGSWATLFDDAYRIRVNKN